MVACPRCKSEDCELGKSWDVIPKSSRGRAIHVTMYSCKICSHKFRKATRFDVPATCILEGNNLETKPEMKSLTTPELPKLTVTEVSHPPLMMEQRTLTAEIDVPSHDSLFQKIKRGLGF